MADHGHEAKPEVNITIDRKHKRSPNPTTGAALCALGEVPAGYVLYREVPGPKDDEPIGNGGGALELKDGDRFYTSQETINPGGR